MQPQHRTPTHPGEILLKEFLEPMKMTQMALARALRIPLQRVNTIVNGKRGVTAETAVLLAGQFKTTPQFWMNLQSMYDVGRVLSRRSRVRARYPKPRIGLVAAERRAH